MKFVVTIEEVVTEDFEIEAESLEKAMQFAEDRYYNSKLVLCSGNLVSKKMLVSSEDGKESTEWMEF